MPELRVLYGSTEDLHGGRMLYSPGPRRVQNFHVDSQHDLTGRQSSLSTRSMPHSLDDFFYDDGAEIPDIPLRRSSISSKSSRRKTAIKNMVPPVATSSAVPDRTMTPRMESMLGDTPHGVVAPPRANRSSSIGIPERNGKRPISPFVGKQEYGPLPPEQEEELRLESRSTTTYPQSMRSKVHSSASSYVATEGSSLPALQTRAAGDDISGLEPLIEDEVEPGSFDLVVPSHGEAGVYSLEKRSEMLFSKEHLQVIFDDPVLLQRFTRWMCALRPASVPLLVYYLDALKALRAINYTNAIIEALTPMEGHDFSSNTAAATANASLQAKADAAFDALVAEELPAFITHVWVGIVSISIKQRIAGTLPLHLRDMSEGLAEVFCLTDPSRRDNPIIFASEEFHRTTQYGMNYVIGRNCRFLQGPKTNPLSIRRIREKLAAGQEHYETFLNYRRDGSPFMNLVLLAPLFDSRGILRYHIGAQVDVSGLAKDCAGLKSLQRLVDRSEEQHPANPNQNTTDQVPDLPTQGQGLPIPKDDEFRQLSEMLNMQELETVRRFGGATHRTQHEEIQHTDQGPGTSNWHRPRILIQESENGASSTGGSQGYSSVDLANRAAASSGPSNNPLNNGRLAGAYEHYLLVRPYPSLRILFASPSLRVPGILQSPFLGKIGGSERIRGELERALAEGHGVTAKIRWVVNRGTGEGRPRWIHCTPLIGANGAIGVWMVVIVDEDEPDEAAVLLQNQGRGRSGRETPPVVGRSGRETPRGGMRGGHARSKAMNGMDEIESIAAGYVGSSERGGRNGVSEGWEG